MSPTPLARLLGILGKMLEGSWSLVSCRIQVVQHQSCKDTTGEMERRAGDVKSEGQKGKGVWGGAEGDREARNGVLSARVGVACQFRDTGLATSTRAHRASHTDLGKSCSFLAALCQGSCSAVARVVSARKGGLARLRGELEAENVTG